MSEKEYLQADLDHAATIFLSVRPRLFGIGYRMLGSAAEAEDLVQEVWLRWQATDRSVVLDPSAFLSTTTVRLAINSLNSARSKRESYIGPWLPEPIDLSADPSLGAERSESLSFALLMLLEKLNANERAAYILREAFDYDYPHIAEILSLSEANVRQLVSRARKHISDSRPAAPAPPDDHRRLLEAFLQAAKTGDQAALEKIFSNEIVSIADGGGVVTAARVPLFGRERIARAISAFAAKFWQDASFSITHFNGESTLLISRQGTPFTLMFFTTDANGIAQILWVMNPAKLTSPTLTQVADEARDLPPHRSI